MLPFVQPFLESDAAEPDSDNEDPQDPSDEPLEDEELADLRREYGKPASQASQCLPALSELVESIQGGDQAQPAPKPVQLLRAHAPGTKAATADDGTVENDAPKEDDDWDLLGVECDCPCTSCRLTLVAPQFDDHVRLQRLVQQELKEFAEDEEGNAVQDASSRVIPCECFELHPPECKHDLIVDLLEDFFRLRVHMHRITFAESIADAEVRLLSQQSSSATRRKGQPRINREKESERLDALRRSAYTRALVLLKARCRRDLRHIELLEACANQLGWNHPSAPALLPSVVFCEYASPAGLNVQERSVVDELNPGSAVHRGGDLLSGIVVDFLLYFLPLKTTCSNFDKSRCVTLLQNLLAFAIACHDLDPADRVTKEALVVCERSTLDLPLADLVETELAKVVQEREAREAAAKEADKSRLGAAAMSVGDAGAGSTALDDADIFPRRAPSSSLSAGPAVIEAFQGYFLIDSFSAPSALSEHQSSRAPPLLHLRPAMKTRAKMHVYRALEKQDQEALESKKDAPAAPDAASAGAPSAAAASSRRALQSSAPSLHCSSLLSVVVPHMVLELLSNATDQGQGWRLNLEITRYDDRDLRTVQMGQQGAASSAATPLFHITKSGHVSCA